MEINKTALNELLQVSRKQVEILERIVNGGVYSDNKKVIANQDIRFPKDTAYLKILRGSSGLNEWQQGFLDNLISNEYTSITVKQKETVDGISKQVKNG